MTVTSALRLVPADVLDDLRHRAALGDAVQDVVRQTELLSVHHAATLYALRTTTARADTATAYLNAATDDLTVFVLRRSQAVRLLDAIDTAELPPAVAAQIRAACDVLEHGGEEGPG
ncbi:hypothetical protein [Streptomyces sp. NPDC052496]|uniref:hypothetical protein n=1 Tax=Streptomyces sp. NPDC052496 TaxID=3154951 RepID=UPI0034127354